MQASLASMVLWIDKMLNQWLSRNIPLHTVFYHVFIYPNWYRISSIKSISRIPLQWRAVARESIGTFLSDVKLLKMFPLESCTTTHLEKPILWWATSSNPHCIRKFGLTFTNLAFKYSHCWRMMAGLDCQTPPLCGISKAYHALHWPHHLHQQQSIKKYTILAARLAGVNCKHHYIVSSYLNIIITFHHHIHHWSSKSGHLKHGKHNMSYEFDVVCQAVTAFCGTVKESTRCNNSYR